MIAALGMYDMQAIQAANDRLWDMIRQHLNDGPDRLTRDMDMWQIWQSPDLVLAQTCGFPYRACLHGKVTLVGTPDYGVEDCPPGYYRSVLVARSTDDRSLAGLATGVFAYNEPMSQSGWAAPVAHFADLNLTIGGLIETGSHTGSADAVANGQADLAALDAVTWALLLNNDPVAQQLRVVDRTRSTPGLPFITSLRRDPKPIASAIRSAIGELDETDRKSLCLTGLADISAASYLS
ncbi:MAG: PhnD/SsuA/transferrin family substrate-binding protein, partial [Pseudomonadota bacterium]